MNFSSHSGFEWLRTLYYGTWWKWSSDHYELNNSRVIGLNHKLPFYVTLDCLHTSSFLGSYIFLSTCFQIFVIFVGLKVLTAVAMKSSVFCGIMLCCKACLLIGLLYKPEDEGNMFLQESVDFHKAIWCYNSKTELFSYDSYSLPTKKEIHFKPQNTIDQITGLSILVFINLKSMWDHNSFLTEY
jgi:hypothetical protein